MTKKELPESTPRESKAEVSGIEGKTGRLMRFFNGAMIKAEFSRVNVTGLEHLKEIPSRRNVIFVTTHMTGTDMPLALKVLGEHVKLAIANQSVHHTLRGEWSMRVGMFLTGGKKNFLKIDWEKKKGEKKAKFNPDNFIEMQKAMGAGKAILMAGHNPSADGKLEKGGYGAAYLAHLSNAILVPVAINLKAKEVMGVDGKLVKLLMNRPEAEVTIGVPFSLEKIDGVEDFAKTFHKVRDKEELTDEERANFLEVKRALREESDEEIMMRLANMVPEEKRGIYSHSEESNI